LSIILTGKENLSDSVHALANPKRLLPLPVSCWWPSGTCSVDGVLISTGPVQAVARSLHSFPARCGTRCRQTPLSGSALASLLGSVGAWRRSGSNSLQRSPLSPQRCAPGKRKDLRALQLPILSTLPKASTLLFPVKTRATRVALLRYASLDAPQYALFAAVRPDLKAKI
jgi:hypothetical protein